MADALQAPHIPERMQAIEGLAAQAPLGTDLPISNEVEKVFRAIGTQTLSFCTNWSSFERRLKTFGNRFGNRESSLPLVSMALELTARIVNNFYQ